MAEAKRKANSKQVLDVHKPGKTAADASSKPIIVTNRQIIRDPMVTAEATSPVVETKSAPPVPVEAPAPAEDPEASGEATSSQPTELKHELIVTPVSKPAPKEEPEAEKPEDKPEEAAPELNEAAIESAAEEAEAKREVELQKLVDKKQYFLPINALEQRKAEQFVALGILLVIILGLAWVDISLDAGLIHIGNVHPLTHFFSN